VNAIEEAVGVQLVTALVGGVQVQLELTPVRITIEAGLLDDQFIFFPGLPEGADILVGLSVPLLFPSDVDVPLCLAADTLIRTPDGLRPAREIKAGDLVETVRRRSPAGPLDRPAVGGLPAGKPPGQASPLHHPQGRLRNRAAVP
jgi:hypothetical protein